MKRNLFAIFLALTLVVTLTFVIAPKAQASSNMLTPAAADENGKITVTENGKILDLQGATLSVELADGITLSVVDTANTKADGTGAGKLTVNAPERVNIVSQYPEVLNNEAADYGFSLMRYLKVKNTDEDTYSFHPFNLTVVQYGINTKANGGPAIALRTAFMANNVVLNYLDDYGISTGGANYTVEEKYPLNKNFVYAYADLIGSLDAQPEEGESVANIDKTAVFNAYMTFKFGEETYTITSTNGEEITPREILKKINAGILLNEGEDGKIIPTEAQANAIKALMGTNTRANNIFSCYGGVCNHEKAENWICLDCDETLEDTSAYELTNGGFENGLDGWTLVGNIGGISSDTHYWLGDPESAEGFAFGMDGEKMFSAYAPGAEERLVGTLTSSTFTVGGSGFVTFKVGAMRDGNYVYVDVVDANTKQILARYYNGLWAERTDDVKSGCTLIAYKADLSAFMGREVFFRISDNADSGYGLFFADSFVTYYRNEPEGFNPATPVNYAVSGTIYDLFNGGFEMGDVQGWWNIGEIGVVTNANGYWGDNIPYEKVGDFLFTGVESFGADTMREGNRGVLTSSVFEIGGTGWISFKLGGGGNALCYVQVIDAVTGEILARYHQQAQRDAVLIQYVADLSAYIGRTVRIQVVDQADSGWGCVSFDDVVTYYPSTDSLPAGHTANDIKGNIKYTIDNGSFETGNIDGWTMHITEGGAHNTLGWVLEHEIDAGWYTKNDDTKDGRFLFTFAQPGDINCENTKGVLQSSTFSLKQGAFVSFKFGAAGGWQNHDVYIELCRADGSVIARFFNDAPGKVNTRMNAYYYQYNGIEVDCFFRVVDNSTGDYGCLVIDDFRVNLESAPEGFIAAIQ